jgi:hypothetical protein
MKFAPTEPWDSPVQGATLLDDIRKALLDHVIITEHEATSVALWILHAHAHDQFAISAILALISPDKRCGKTTLLSILTHLVPTALAASNVSTAVVYRSIEKHRPTLLIDEADTFLNENRELVGILNSGHSRAAALIVRASAENFEPQSFSTWAPKVIAKIGPLPPTLEDRSIIVRLRRKLPTKKVLPLTPSRTAALVTLRRQAARWVADHATEIGECDPQVPSELHDRAADNWRPLHAIADIAGDGWPDQAREAARSMSAGSANADDGSVALLGDIRMIWSENFTGESIPSAELVRALNALEEAPWGRKRSGRGLDQHTLARFLQPFNVRTCSIWIGSTEGRSCRGYRLEDFEDAFARYLPPPSEPEMPER